jgi:hypothetical protein
MNNHLTASHDFVVILGGRSSVLASAVNAVSDHFLDHRQQSSLPAG